MRYRELDLNLLVVLEALLAECSVSRAAQRLHRSQPAISMALARLREHYQDELLVPEGRGLAPTPRARELLPELRALLAQLKRVAGPPEDFAPARCELRFEISASDYALSVLLPPLVRHLARCAPGVTLAARELPPLRTDARGLVAEALEMRHHDLIVLPAERQAAGFPAQPLFEDRLCVLAWRHHPLLQEQDALDAAAYTALPHIVREFGEGRWQAMDQARLERLGVQRRVVLGVGSFGLLPELLEGSDRLATVFSLQARQWMRHHPLRCWPLPWDVAPVPQVMQWKADTQHAPAQAWLRAQVAEVAAGLGASEPADAPGAPAASG